MLVQLCRVDRIVSFVKLIELAVELLLIEAVGDRSLIEGAGPQTRLGTFLSGSGRIASSGRGSVLLCFLLVFVLVVDSVVEVSVIV